MKNVLLILLLGGVLALGWHSTDAVLDPVLLRRAIQEYTARREKLDNRKYVTVIDYRRDFLQPRLFVYNVEEHRVVLRSRVSHALKSGLLYATDFSNAVGSEKSCVGVFRTDKQVYKGRFGQALRLDGLSNNLNSNCRARTVVFHPVSNYLGRWSQGCFMTSPSVNNQLTLLIQGRSLVVVYK
jgi:hypothetical protein